MKPVYRSLHQWDGYCGMNDVIVLPGASQIVICRSLSLSPCSVILDLGSRIVDHHFQTMGIRHDCLDINKGPLSS